MNNMNLSEPVFNRIRDIIHSITGIYMGYEKEYLIRQKLLPFMENNNISDYHQLARFLEDSNYTQWKNAIISAITINETSFFRDNHPFINLGHLFEKHFSKEDINILSIGCSGGQEPISIAITASETGKDTLSRLKIHAMDIDTQMIETAKTGLYRKSEIQRGVKDEYINKYFEQTDEYYTVKPNILEVIEYKNGNVNQRIPFTDTLYDIVFIRNVMIYFQQSTKENVIHSIMKKMKPNGYLILGSSENIFGLNNLFSSEIWGKSIFYRRKV